MSTATVTPTPTAMPAPKPNNILDNAFLLVVTRRWPPQTKTISSPVLNSNANAGMISVNKKLFNSPELKAIIAEEVKLDEFLKRNATPFPMRKGHHFLAMDLYGKVENYFQEHVAKRTQLIDNFVAAYESAVVESKNLLGDQFNQNDYPPQTVIRSYFFLGWDYLQFSVSDKLKQLDPIMAERKEQEFQAQIIQAGEAANSLLAEQMQKILAHLADRLTPTIDDESGEVKRKTFRDKMLDPVNDFLAVVDYRNLGQHEGIKALAAKVRGMMEGVSVDVLKSNADLRNKLELQIKEVKDEVDKIVVDMPARAITFFEE